MVEILAQPSLESPWYWVLHLVVWTVVCWRTLGVPHDMVVRARRDPEVAVRVEILAGIGAARTAGLYDDAGGPLAAIAGFALAGLFVLGFGMDLEGAQATFLILLPLAVITASKLRLALAVRGGRLAPDDLIRAFARRRLWHQAISIVALFATGLIAVAQHPRLLLP